MKNDSYYYLKTVAGPEVSGEKLEKLWELTHIVKDARNSLDPELLITRLAEDAVYEAQGVQEPLCGNDEIAEYLRKRFEFIRSVSAERDTGTMTPGVVDLPEGVNYPCLIFELEGERDALWVVDSSDDGKIRRIDILTVAPHPHEARKYDGY